jgi:hypothetical protein
MEWGKVQGSAHADMAYAGLAHADMAHADMAHADMGESVTHRGGVWLRINIK